MRHSFVRFVTPVLDKHAGRRLGSFTLAYGLIDADVLSKNDREELQILLKWFEAHLAEPDRLARGQRKHASPRAISWFRISATEHIKRMRSMCRILNEHGIRTEMITSARPGYIVFEDEHQVAAVPFKETTT